eukprot:1995595-Prymnesium_polylepis.1
MADAWPRRCVQCGLVTEAVGRWQAFACAGASAVPAGAGAEWGRRGCVQKVVPSVVAAGPSPAHAHSLAPRASAVHMCLGAMTPRDPYVWLHRFRDRAARADPDERDTHR